MASYPNWNHNWRDTPPREVWRIPVGLGWAGFAVVGRRAITQEQREADECVTCYDVTNGRLLWLHKDTVRFSEVMGGDGPRATPTVDAGRLVVFTMGATGILNCLDLVTGSIKWSRDVLKDAGAANLQWGKSCSPVLHRDLVIVTGGEAGPVLLAYKQDSGELAWKSGDEKSCYSTPVVATLGGQEQIVSVNQASVTGHDSTTGGILWRFPWPGGMPKSSQPVITGPDTVLVTSSYSMKSHHLKVGKNPEGRWNCEPLWTSSSPRTKFSNATIVGSHAYALDEGRLACVDMASGERIWREGNYGFGQQTLVNGMLLIQSEQGDVVLVKPDPAGLKELGRISVFKSMTWNPPTPAGRWLLLRNDREAACFEVAPSGKGGVR